MGPVRYALLLALALVEQAPSPDGGAAGPRLVQALDAAKGQKAAAAYMAAVRRHCKSRPDAGAHWPGRWQDVGLRDDSDYAALCEVGPRAIALASGALLQAGADEVLLDVPSGQARALGEDELIVMRAAPGGYRFERAGTIGNSFEGRARVTSPGTRDAVLVCERTGHGGLYPLPCGFFNQGHFSGLADSGADGETDLHLGSTTVCGPTASLSLGKIALHDDHLVVEIVVEKGC
jgi:hypothetical protein